jgi:hypothetical protein
MFSYFSFKYIHCCHATLSPYLQLCLFHISPARRSLVLHVNFFRIRTESNDFQWRVKGDKQASSLCRFAVLFAKAKALIFAFSPFHCMATHRARDKSESTLLLHSSSQFFVRFSFSLSRPLQMEKFFTTPKVNKIITDDKFESFKCEGGTASGNSKSSLSFFHIVRRQTRRHEE